MSHVREAAAWRHSGRRVTVRDGCVDVWRVDTDALSGSGAGACECLSHDERERAARLATDVLRRRFLAGHAAMRIVLGRYLGVPAADLGFSAGPHGKPALAAPFSESGVRFNMGHSRHLALLAVAVSREVGVDIEYLRQGVDHHAIAERHFASADAHRIVQAAAGDRPRLFFEQWCRHEALVKAVGIGLGGATSDLRVAPPVEGTFAAAGSRWSLTTIAIDAGFAAALAVEGDAPQIRYYQYYSGDAGRHGQLGIADG